MQTITLSDILTANRDALQKGSLLAQSKTGGLTAFDSCLYRDGVTKDGHPIGCAIGVALNDDTIKTIMDDGWNRGIGVEGLMLNNIIKFDSYDTELIAIALQSVHDAWVVDYVYMKRLDKPSKIEEINDFISSIVGKRVNEEMYRQLLDILEKAAA